MAALLVIAVMLSLKRLPHEKLGRLSLPSSLQAATNRLLRELAEELLVLPERDLSLLAPLPSILTPEPERMVRVVADADNDEIARSIDAVLLPLTPC